MRATTFEFRWRALIIGLIYWAGFSCSFFDHEISAVALARRLAPGGDLDAPAGRALLHGVFALAAACMLVCVLIRTWAAAYLRTDVVHDPNLRSDRVVADGPYRFIRNPLYFGVIFMGAGLGAMADTAGWFIIVIGLVVFTLRLIGREEVNLDEQLGDSYRAYKAAVPRLWPSLRPRLPAGDGVPRWGQALLGESFFWGLLITLIVVAITLKAQWGYIGLGASLACLVLATLLRKQVSGAASSKA